MCISSQVSVVSCIKIIHQQRTLITPSATASAKISNYFCAQLTKQHIELFTKVHHTDFLFLAFASCFYYYLAGCNSHLWWTDRFILLACGVFHRDSRFANHRFPFCKLHISILQSISIFPCHKLQISRTCATPTTRKRFKIFFLHNINSSDQSVF